MPTALSIALLALLSCSPEVAPPAPPPVRPVPAPAPLYTWEPEVLEAARRLTCFADTGRAAELDAAIAALHGLIRPGERQDFARLLLAWALRLQGQEAASEAALAEVDPLHRPAWDYFFTRSPAALAPLLRGLVAAGCAERNDLPGVDCAHATAPASLPADFPVWEQLSWRAHATDRLGGWSRARSGQTAADLGRRIGLGPGLDVADIGAGEGWFTLPFAQLVAPGGEVWAEEVDPAYLDYITFAAERLDLENVHTVLGGPLDANLPEGALDLVFVCEVFKWIYTNPDAVDPARVEATALPFLRSLHRGLRPGGRLVIIEHDRPMGSRKDISPVYLRRDAERVGFHFVEQLPDYGPLQITLVLARD
ncbi:MAG: methyltransferase domain-containing protein [Pseudomonadota bacterium]